MHDVFVPNYHRPGDCMAAFAGKTPSGAEDLAVSIAANLGGDPIHDLGGGG